MPGKHLDTPTVVTAGGWNGMPVVSASDVAHISRLADGDPEVLEALGLIEYTGTDTLSTKKSRRTTRSPEIAHDH